MDLSLVQESRRRRLIFLWNSCGIALMVSHSGDPDRYLLPEAGASDDRFNLNSSMQCFDTRLS
jgi:hypothetical protein